MTCEVSGFALTDEKLNNNPNNKIKQSKIARTVYLIVTYDISFKTQNTALAQFYIKLIT